MLLLSNMETIHTTSSVGATCVQRMLVEPVTCGADCARLVATLMTAPLSRQLIERKLRHVVQQRNERVSLVLGGQAAFLGGRRRGVAKRAFRVEILRNPAESMLAGGTQVL